MVMDSSVVEHNLQIRADGDLPNPFRDNGGRGNKKVSANVRSLTKKDVNTNKKSSQREKKPISEIDRRAARNLKRIWLLYQERHDISQETAAQDLGWCQGNFSLYLNGKIRLSDKVLRRFCDYFGCRVTDVREELRDKRMASRLMVLEELIGEMLVVTESVKTLDAVRVSIKARNLLYK